MGFAASGGNATKQLAAVRGVGPRRVSSSRRRHRRDPRGLAPPWGTGMRRGSRQTQRPASEPPGPTVAADDAPTSCLGDNGTASLPWALSTATCSAQVRRPASRPSFPTPSQPQRPTPRCRQICAGTTSSCSNFPGGSVHFRPFPLEKISPAPGNRIRLGVPVAHQFDYPACDDLLGVRRTSVPIYSAAYIMPPGRRSGVPKHRMHLRLIRDMIADRLPVKLQRTRSLQAAYELMLAWPTLGPFLAFQYAIDLNSLVSHIFRTTPATIGGQRGPVATAS